jgi:hypothetical protein
MEHTQITSPDHPPWSQNLVIVSASIAVLVAVGDSVYISCVWLVWPVSSSAEGIFMFQTFLLWSLDAVLLLPQHLYPCFLSLGGSGYCIKLFGGIQQRLDNMKS